MNDFDFLREIKDQIDKFNENNDLKLEYPKTVSILIEDNDPESKKNISFQCDIKKSISKDSIGSYRYETINKTQHEELLFHLEGFSDIAKKIMEVYEIDTLADLPASQYFIARDRIAKIKKTQEEYLRKK